jgi:hypothetical protein
MIDQTSRIFATLTMFWAAASAFAANPVDAEPCIAKYGDVVAFERCNPVRLPGVEVRFVGFSQPNKGIPMVCWNYEASVSGSEKATFRHCHTGELGGQTNFSVMGSSFTVVFDVSKGCKRLPVGSWAPEIRGHAFYAGILDASTLEEMWRKQEQSEKVCFARKGA